MANAKTKYGRVEELVKRDQRQQQVANRLELERLQKLFRKPTGPVADRMKELELYNK